MSQIIPHPKELQLHLRQNGLRLACGEAGTIDVTICSAGFIVRRVEDEYRQRRLFPVCGFGCELDCRCRVRCDGHCQPEPGGICDGECYWSNYDVETPEMWFPCLGASLVDCRLIPSRIVWCLYHYMEPPTAALRLIQDTASKQIIEHCKLLVKHADPTILSIQKTVFSVTCDLANIFLYRSLYQQPFLVKDLQSCRAAAAVVSVAPSILFLRREHEGCNNRFELQERVLDSLTDWQAILSPTRKRYRSLNKTLSALPGRIPLRLLQRLVQIELERPITDRVELIALLEAFDYLGGIHWGVLQNRPYQEVWQCFPNLRIFMHAQRGELCAAMRRIGEELGRPLSARSAKDIASMARYLMAFPENHPGKLAGLVRKSIAWHRAGALCGEDYLDEEEIEFRNLLRTQAPPIEPPDDPHITRLKTVGDIDREGSLMQTCVAGHGGFAVAGGSYLFHCEFRGQHATIEIDRSGRFVEAGGPFNQNNEAVEYSTKVLTDWGKKLAKVALKQRSAWR